MTPCLRRSLTLGILFILLLKIDPATAQGTAVEDLQTDSLQISPDDPRYQYYRASDSWYLKGRLGLNFYGGDRDINPNNEIQKYIENIGFSLGAEIGYHFSDRFSLGLKHLASRYPRIEDDADENGRLFERPAYGVIDAANTSKWRHHLSLIGRSYMLPRKRVSPYGQMGFSVGFGKINGETRFGIGPEASIGLDAAVSDRIGIFLELNGIFIFDDDALDLADTRSQSLDIKGSTDASDFDAFTIFGFGLRFNFKSPLIPPEIDCAGSERLKIGDTCTFAITPLNQATLPITYEWDFGDGATGSGLLVTHEFASSGTFPVTVTARNRAGTATATCPVLILEPPSCSIEAIPALSMCQQPLPPVNFSARVSGTLPITYQWNFGDGTSSTETNPTHTYTRIDADPTTTTYNATLRVSNEADASTCTVAVNIEACPCRDLSELGQACFERNTSVLRAEADDPQSLQNLRDNLQILRQNPSIEILIEGYASPNERGAQQLAEDRARAVRDFYVSGGIDASRIQVRGVVQPQASKAGPICTLTIPLPCDENERARFLQERLGGE